MFERSSRSHSAICTGVGMVDKPVSGTGAERHAGSSPALCTIYVLSSVGRAAVF